MHDVCLGCGNARLTACGDYSNARLQCMQDESVQATWRAAVVASVHREGQPKVTLVAEFWLPAGSQTNDCNL